MSRKDYQLIADELKRSAPEFPDSEDPNFSSRHARHAGFAVAVEAVARALAIENPRFDSKRFYAAVYPHLVRE